VYQQEYFLMSTTLTLRTAGLPLAAFGGAMLLASTALSAPLASVDVDSVVGKFENATDVAGSGGGVGGASDIDYDDATNTASIVWGVPGPSGTGLQSGYTFAGDAPPTFAAPTDGSIFSLGEFDHQNEPILNSSLRVKTVDLNLTIDTEIGSFNPIYTLTHLETRNVEPCAFPSDTPCADTVTISTITEVAIGKVTVGKYVYSLFIDGFLNSDGEVVTQLVTQEQGVNAAHLVGRITVAPIPLPAAGFLLLGALGGLGLMSRRKAA
jgi:hypothetical protein